MSSLIAALVLAVAPADDAAAKELAALAEKLKDAQSYTFEYQPVARAAPAAKPAAEGEKKGEADDDDKDPAAWKVEIQRQSPWHYQRGELELFRHEMLFAMKGKEGKWSRVGAAPNPRKGPGSSAGGAPAKTDKGEKGDDDGDDGNDGKKGGGGEKGGKGGGRRGAQRVAAAAASVPLVHQLFHDFAKKASGVTKDEKPSADGEVVYVATLTPAAARELVGEGRSMRPGGEGRAPGKAGGDGKEPNVAVGADHGGEAAATLRIGVKDGAIHTVAIDATTKNAGGEHKSGGRITLSNVNATKIVVPPEAQALLAGPPAHDGGGPDKK